jgi:hypothetical protein
MKNKKIIVGFLFLFFIIYIAAFSSCAMPTISRFSEDDLLVDDATDDTTDNIPQEVLKVTKTTETLSLAWNYDEPGNVKSYEVYYRTHGTIDWTWLHSIIPPEPFYEVDKTDVGIGTWDFGISVIDLQDIESEIHTSLDSNAEPTSGWYLSWEN